MSASPPRTVRSAAVHGTLRAQILGGALLPGDAIGSERVLAERFSCNRHAAREAVKRLQQAGLVAVTHGGATRVLDWRAHGASSCWPTSRRCWRAPIARARCAASP